MTLESVAPSSESSVAATERAFRRRRLIAATPPVLCLERHVRGSGSPATDGGSRRCGLSWCAGHAGGSSGCRRRRCGLRRFHLAGCSLAGAQPVADYLPIDIRPEAVAAHRARGFAGRVGSATDLALPAGSVDIVHARFVCAWLDAAGRRRAMMESLHASRGAARVVVIDYDWASAAGPDAVVAWKEKVLDLLSAFGFDPFYGQRLGLDMVEHLSGADLAPSDFAMRVESATSTQLFGDAMSTMAVLGESLIERLVTFGLDADADELLRLQDAVRQDCRANPEGSITLPTIVAATMDLADTASAAAVARIGRRRAAGGRHVVSKALRYAGPAELGVRLLESDLVTEARRLHAAEYLNRRYLTEESVDADGFLIAEFDPPEVLARSTYLGVLDDEGHVAASIRMISPADSDPMTLPTLHKCMAGRPTDGPWLRCLGLPLGSSIFEVSGLAMSSRCTDRVSTTRLLLAVVCEARLRGYDVGVMAIVDAIARLLFATYGEQAIRPLDQSLGTIGLTGVGVRHGGITLIPCYAQTNTFVSDCLQHCMMWPTRASSRLNRPLVELTASAFFH